MLLLKKNSWGDIFDMQKTSSKDLFKDSERQQSIKKSVKDYTKDSNNNTYDTKKDDLTIIQECVGRGLPNLKPKLFFQNIVKNLDNAKQLYGKTLLRLITGFDADFIEKNIKVPEFLRELEANIYKKLNSLQEKMFIDEEGSLTEEAIKNMAEVLLSDLDLASKQFGESLTKFETVYGDAQDVYYNNYNSQNKRYRDLAINRTLKLAFRRKRKSITPQELVFRKRYQHGGLSLVYCIDASGSMRGDKINAAKRAGLMLSFKALKDNNKVAILGFSSQVDSLIPLTKNFKQIIQVISRLKPKGQTSLAIAIEKSVEILTGEKSAKHIILITDAMPTAGRKPAQDALTAVARARDDGITTSIVGVRLSQEAAKLAQQITAIGSGRLFVVNTEQIGGFVITDYEMVKQQFLNKNNRVNN